MAGPETVQGHQAVETGANWRRLAAAVLVRAVLDALDEDSTLAAPARRWLATQGMVWAGWLGLSTERLARWLAELPAL
jgi:hypothetical protein